MFVQHEMYALWYWLPITFIYSEKSLIKLVRSCIVTVCTIDRANQIIFTTKSSAPYFNINIFKYS